VQCQGSNARGETLGSTASVTTSAAARFSISGYGQDTSGNWHIGITTYWTGVMTQDPTRLETFTVQSRANATSPWTNSGITGIRVCGWAEPPGCSVQLTGSLGWGSGQEHRLVLTSGAISLNRMRMTGQLQGSWPTYTLVEGSG